MTPITQMMIMHTSGYIMVFLIFLLATFIASQFMGLRTSGASIVASLSMAFPSNLLLLLLFPKIDLNPWIVAFYMLSCVAVYMLWLYIFQPASLKDLAIKELRKEKIAAVDEKIHEVRLAILKARAAKDEVQVVKLQGMLSQLMNELRIIKKQFSKIHRFKNWLKALKPKPKTDIKVE